MRPPLLVLFVLVLTVAASEALPKRGGGSFGSRGGSFGGRSRSGGFGKSKGRGSTLKKAAVIGATAYGAYQLGKLSGRFSGYHGGYGFDEWNDWREADGFLCRNNEDCNWIDPNLYCQDYELDFEPSALWFGGDAARIVGECACRHGLVWNDWETDCEPASLLDIGITAAIISVLSMICCAGLVFCIVRKLCT